MAYKVLIVDDEEIMREGLANLIEWETMGFEIADKFEDGQNAINYIKTHPVDVVLTDIKMTRVSGLDLARFIYDNKSSTKVVLISAYKEFELAQKAISYNVMHYLLKPVEFQDIYNVFSKIKEQLDMEREDKRQAIEKNNKMEELLTLSRMQFFADAAMGAFTSEEEVLEKVKLLGLNIDPENSECCILYISIGDCKNWSYSREGLYTAVKNFFNRTKPSIRYFDLGSFKGVIRFLAVRCDRSPLDFKEEIESQLKEIRQGIKSLLGMDILVRTGRFCSNILHMSLTSNVIEKNKGFWQEADANEVELSIMTEQLKLILTHILEKEPELSRGIFERHLEELRQYDKKAVQKYLIDFFPLLINRLIVNGVNNGKVNKEIPDYSVFMRYEHMNEIIDHAKKTFAGIMRQVEGDTNKREGVVIAQIKQYIANNYNRDMTLEDVADAVFLSPVYVSRLFKDKTGENFSDYVIKIKIEKAMELLGNPKYRVYDISNRIGYSSLKYFYKLFKKYTGCTPTEYRNKILYGEN